MLRLTLKGVRGHLGRFLLTALAVMLGTAFVAGTFVLTDSIERTFSQIFSAGTAGTDVVVRGALPEGEDAAVTGPFGGNRPPLPGDLVDDLAAVDGVARASADLSGTALLVGADGTAVSGGGQAPAFGFAYREDDPALTVVDGRGPTAADEVAVETSTLARSGLTIGDRTRVVVGPAPRDVEVVGEVSYGAALAGATLVVIDEASATQLFSPDGTVGTFSLTAEEGTTQEQLREAVTAVLPDGAEAVTGEASTAEQQEALSGALGFVNTFLLVFAAVALFVGGFIIANTFSMLVAQRTRELALLRALGANRNQVLGSVLGEAAVVGLLGGLLGLGVGVGLAALLQTVLSATVGFEFSGGLPVAPRTVVAALAVGVLVTLLSAVAPALRASRTAPVAAMRDDIALPESSLRRRGVVAAVLAVAAVALGAAGIAGEANRGALVGGAALAAVLAVVGAAPFLAGPVVRVLAAPAVALPGVVGRLARENVLRNPRRTAATASALMVGLALVAAVSILASSTSASIEDLVESGLESDYVLAGVGQTPFPASVGEGAAGLDDVASVASVAALPLTLGEAQVFAGAVDPVALADNITVDVVAGDLADLGPDTVALTEGTAGDAGVVVGDTVSLAAGQLPAREARVAAVYADANALTYGALVDVSLYDAAVPAAQRGQAAAYVKAAPGADLTALRGELTELVAPFAVVSVLDREEYVGEQTAQIDQILGIIYALLGLSVVIAIVGIVNTLALSVVERTREIGLLRAVGLTRGQLRRMITVESVCTAVFGAVLGTALGLAFGLALQRILSGQGLEVLSVPVATLVGIVVVAGLVGVVAAVLPALRASRMDVLRALAAD